MADVEINLGTGGSEINNSSVSLGDVTGRDRIERGNAIDAHQQLLIRLEKLERRSDELEQRNEELELMVFGSSKLGVSSVREEIRGLRFWNITSTIITVVWVIYEIIRTHS